MKWSETQDQLAKERRLSFKVRIPIQALKRLFRKLKAKIRRKRNDTMEQP